MTRCLGAQLISINKGASRASAYLRAATIGIHDDDGDDDRDRPIPPTDPLDTTGSVPPAGYARLPARTSAAVRAMVHWRFRHRAIGATHLPQRVAPSFLGPLGLLRGRTPVIRPVATTGRSAENGGSALRDDDR